MIKKIILMCVFFVSSALAQQQFKSDEFVFEITFPDYMVVNRGTSGNPAVLASVGSNTSINVVLQEVNDTLKKSMNDYDLEPFIDTLKNALADLPAFTSIDYGRIEINGSSSIYISYKFLKGNDVTRVKQYFLKHSSKMYGITTISPESEAADYETMFNEIVNSFSLIKQK